MNDRELLEMAAKAAGLGEVWYLGGHDASYVGPKYKPGNPVQYRPWNPLTDDGDALRLAVALRMLIRIKTLPHVVYVEVFNGTAPSIIEPLADIRKQALDEFAATRRAITRAAAEIGKALP